MDKGKKDLKGSPSRDLFKQLHKKNMPGGFYACDIDLTLVDKEPAGIRALLDYKNFQDIVTFSEVIAYNQLMEYMPIYIIKSSREKIESGPFYIFQYVGGDWKPEPPKVTLNQILKCKDWKELTDWEREIRGYYA